VELSDTASFSRSSDSQIGRFAAAAVQAAPVAVVVACAASLAWREHGSIVRGSWLPYSMAIALVAATVLFAGVAARPSRLATIGIAGVVGLAAWDAVSALWAPSPALARDEGFLTATYALALGLAVVTLWSERRRLVAVSCVAAGSGALALLACVVLVWGGDPLGRYFGGRLAFPITYVNATAALFATGFWPALAVAARREGRLVVRAAALAAAELALAATVLTQSKGAVLGLAVGTVLVFVLAPMRLRLVAPLVLVAVPAAIAFSRLTEPFRVDGPDAVRHAGAAALTLGIVAALLALPYALLDAQVRIDERTQRETARALLVLVVAALLAGIVGFFVRVPHPQAWVSAKWDAAHHYSTADDARSTHLLQLGSNRFDFWRVARGELARHPVLGDGARGFGPAYLVRGRSSETPRRAHSLPMDVLAETGLAGFGLLVVGLGAPLWLVLRRARRGELLAVAALGGFLVWLVQACVDWTWTFPAVTLPAFVLLGAGASARDGFGAVPKPAARLIAAGAVVLALLVFGPTWLATRYTERAVTARSAGDLERAARLDPLATDALLLSTWVQPVQLAIPDLERAVDREPDMVATRQALGAAYLALGRKADALEQLEAAQRLYPRSPLIANLVADARKR
jgi:O-antigen ligase